MGILTSSEDPDEMQHIAAFHLGLHCLLRLKQSSGTEIHNLENSTGVPFKCTMDNPIFIVSICMRKSIRIQRVILTKSYDVDYQNKEEGKYQESIQSSTTPDLGHHMGK